VLRTAGEGGLVVELGDVIDPELNARVHRLAREVRARLGERIIEVVPTYRSLLVRHDPLRVPRRGLERELEALLAELPAGPEAASAARTVHVPACYGGELGPDLDFVARHAGLEAREVVELHASATYQVFMLGFTPGFPYLGGLSPRLATPRLETPRQRVDAGCVGIGGVQTGIYPVASPGGWRIIARTPLRLFDPGAPAPFLLAPGDRLRFVPIERGEFDDVARQVAARTYAPRIEGGRAEGQPDEAAPAPQGAPKDERGFAAGTDLERPPVMTVVKPGLLSTIQDQGRPGWLAFGMPLAGAMDPEAYALANLLAGNAPGAAAIEMTLLGGTFRFEEDAYVGIAGADMQAALDGAAVASGSAFPVPRGGVLAFSSAVEGCRAYLAVRGGLDVPPFLGSRSTYVRGAVGGLHGRPLAAGDGVPVGPAGPAPPARALRARDVPRHGREVTLRVLLGPQDDRFAPVGLAAFLGSPYTVTNRNDRMAYQLEGPCIRHLHGPDIVSDALLPGAVQVPGSGMPIVMMADAQTVGGYAKIAAVIGADLPRLAQARRGDTVRFARCSHAEAVQALRAARARLEAIAAELDGKRPARRSGP